MFVDYLLLALSLSLLYHSSARPAPYGMRISCGARENVRSPPTNVMWNKDFAYTGGIPVNGSRPSFITPKLPTVRYFPVYGGPENCYNIGRVPIGHYSVKIFFGLIKDSAFDSEPLFDVSVEGTLICSLKSGWSSNDDEAFVEAIVFLTDHTASLCFHSTGHGDPVVQSIEILQVDENAYNFGPHFGRGTILRTVKRLNCGVTKPIFDADSDGDIWGGNRFWNPMETFNSGAERRLSAKSTIKEASISPNFYPEALYQTALQSDDTKQDITYALDVEPNRNYSIWFHFAEIDTSVTGPGQRIFDIRINGDLKMSDVDIIKMTGDIYIALVLNTTVAVNGRILTITMHAKKGPVLVSAIEVFEVMIAESSTSPDEVRALQNLKNALQLPLRLGWVGEPCVPQEHPWNGVDCHYDKSSGKWVIDGLSLEDQGLRGFLPNDISQLHHLQSLNLSGNSISGVLPLSLGNITRLEILDLSYNSFNGSIPESLGQLTSLRRLYLNSNHLSGKVTPGLGGRLLHRASFNFTDNAGLCGIPGLPTCGPHLSPGAKIGIALGASVGILLIATCLICWWKRRQNILRAQRIAARDAPYAKARTHLRDVQMTRHHNHDHTRTAVENGPSLLS